MNGKPYELIVKEWGDNYKLSLTIDHQTFPVGPEIIKDKENVDFWKLMLETALDRMIIKCKRKHCD